MKTMDQMVTAVFVNFLVRTESQTQPVMVVSVQQALISLVVLVKTVLNVMLHQTLHSATTLALQTPRMAAPSVYVLKVFLVTHVAIVTMFVQMDHQMVAVMVVIVVLIALWEELIMTVQCATQIQIILYVLDRVI